MEAELNDTASHNIANRSALIRDGFDELLSLDAQIAAAIEKHVDPLKKLRTKAFRTLKKDTDITRKVLDVHYRMLKLAKHAAVDAEDDGLTLDNMREVFSALHPGGQLDWLKALNHDGAEKAPDKKAA